MQPWTTKAVLELIPNKLTRDKVLALAIPAHWGSLFADAASARLIWGSIQGTAPTPYQIKGDLQDAKFTCTCPSKKQPCKHALALLYLYAAAPGKFTPAQPPAVLTGWLAQRQQESAAEQARPDPSATERAASAKKAGQRAAQREQNIQAGVNDLERWLFDLLQQGLGSVLEKPPAFWNTTAARMKDLQAPGLARRVHAMAARARSSAHWQDDLLEEMARLYLAMQAYRRLDAFAPGLRADIRNAVGWEQRQKDLQHEPGVPDTWLVLGRSLAPSGRLLVQRTWLVGSVTARPALLLSFTPEGITPADDAPLGRALPGELVFYPSAAPLRAEIRTQQPAERLPAQLPASQTIAQAIALYAGALACNPWIEQYPLALQQVAVARAGDDLLLLDGEKRALPVQRSFASGWSLLAMSGGRPLGVFGEWNGKTFLPLSAWAEGSFYAFPPALGDRGFNE